MDAPPDKLKYTAILQIVLGLFNLFVTWWVLTSFLSAIAWTLASVFTVLTLGMCPVTYCMGCLGLAGLAAVPLGILEIISGIVGLTSPKLGGTVMKIVAVLDILALLFGGMPSVVGGIVAMVFLSSDEVKGYLAAPE